MFDVFCVVSSCIIPCDMEMNGETRQVFMVGSQLMDYDHPQYVKSIDSRVVETAQQGPVSSV